MRYVASAIGGAVLTLLVAAAVLFALDLEIGEENGSEVPELTTITVPDVIGLDPDTAQGRIEALGLNVRRIDPPFSIGGVSVTQQIPPGGTEAPVDATVTLRVVAE